METVASAIEAKIDYEHFRIFRGGRPTYVRPFPISVDFNQIGRDAETPEVKHITKNFLREIGESAIGTHLFVGADRIDYTKGIPDSLPAGASRLPSRIGGLPYGGYSYSHLDARRYEFGCQGVHCLADGRRRNVPVFSGPEMMEVQLLPEVNKAFGVRILCELVNCNPAADRFFYARDDENDAAAMQLVRDWGGTVVTVGEKALTPGSEVVSSPMELARKINTWAGFGGITQK